MLKRPLIFNTPSVILDTEKARAKVERDFEKIVREAVIYLGPRKVKRIVHEITKGRKGNTPDERRNLSMLAEFDAEASKGKVNKRKFAHDFCKRHREQSPEATKRHLERLLKARQEEAKKKTLDERKIQELKSRRGKSLLGAE